MAWDVHARYVRAALDGGADHLLAGQSRDGFWRDYDLPPGPSEAWTTAWVGWCLANMPPDPLVWPALQLAARAVARSRTSGGWGYNRQTGVDADSTAWALRFLARLAHAPRADTGELLGRYLDAHGAAHTFPEAFDAWGAAHADVTPIVGLALLSVRPLPAALAAVRTATLAARLPGGGWTSYWWTTDAYATAWSLELLANSGGVPTAAAVDVRDWLRRPVTDVNTLVLACRLQASLTVGAGLSISARLVEGLLEHVRNGAGFAPSASLLVPPRTAAEPSSAPGAHPDVNGLTSTATACLALARWQASR
jgi:hypothetical protein